MTPCGRVPSAADLRSTARRTEWTISGGDGPGHPLERPEQGLLPALPQPAGRNQFGLEQMLRNYFMQHWYNLSDAAMEDALYDSRAMREFAGVDLGNEAAPDECTILQFRHRMEACDFGSELLRLVNVHLSE